MISTSEGTFIISSSKISSRERDIIFYCSSNPAGCSFTHPPTSNFTSILSFQLLQNSTFLLWYSTHHQFSILVVNRSRLFINPVMLKLIFIFLKLNFFLLFSIDLDKRGLANKLFTAVLKLSCLLCNLAIRFTM